MLDGPNSRFDAVANLANIAQGDSFTVRNGRNWTAAGSFQDNGTLNVGAGSVFTVNGNYSQSGSRRGLHDFAGQFHELR